MRPSGLALAFEEFARRHGLEPLRPDAEGRIRIAADDVEVVCFERFGRLHLVSPLGAVPAPGPAARAWLRKLLGHGLGRMKHGRGTPALTDAGDAVLYASCAAGGVSANDLEARIEEHVNACEGYRAALRPQASPRPAAPAGPAVLRP